MVFLEFSFIGNKVWHIVEIRIVDCLMIYMLILASIHTNILMKILFLFSFVMLFIYVVLSLFIAIIMDTYENIKEFYKVGITNMVFLKAYPMCSIVFEYSFIKSYLLLMNFLGRLPSFTGRRVLYGCGIRPLLKHFLGWQQT